MPYKLNPFTGELDYYQAAPSAYVASVSTTDPSLIVNPTTGAVIIYMFNPMFYTYFGGF